MRVQVNKVGRVKNIATIVQEDQAGAASIAIDRPMTGRKALPREAKAGCCRSL